MSDTPEQRADNLPPSLTRQLIAYIGNKRRLLPFLAPILAGLRGGSTGTKVFLDPMCGSGAVSRLARHLGFAVHANDWEEFSWLVTAAYLENSSDDLDRLFRPYGGVEQMVAGLNEYGWAQSKSASDNQRGYIARNFAPESTQAPRIGEERLFYTAENARFIDRVRDRIETLFPCDPGDPPSRASDTGRIRRVLLALLIYEASNHANTSGVFKAYHRGFGGHGRDALSRILAPMQLELPTRIDGPVGEACNQDAREFVRNHSADLCYLDPPYNSHQYGSNYFMLNTIARWDKPIVDATLDGAGHLRVKAGIRPDWKETRSPFCYRRTAAAAVSNLVDSIDAGTIVISYSESGFIKPEEMADLLAPHGSLALHGTGYSAYRGGRQSITRAVSGHELVFVLSRKPAGLRRIETDHRRPAARASGTRIPGDTTAASRDVARQLGEWRVHHLLRGSFVPGRLRSEFETTGDSVILAGAVSVTTPDFYRLDADGVDLSGLSSAELQTVTEGLTRAACSDHSEVFAVLLELIRETADQRLLRSYQNRAATALRKFAHPKYRRQFWESVAMLKTEIDRRPEALGRAAIMLSRITNQARSRFGE